MLICFDSVSVHECESECECIEEVFTAGFILFRWSYGMKKVILWQEVRWLWDNITVT